MEKGLTINKYNSLRGPQTETGIVGKKFICAQTERGCTREDIHFPASQLDLESEEMPPTSRPNYYISVTNDSTFEFQ